jgi:hypothetical protein
MAGLQALDLSIEVRILVPQFILYCHACSIINVTLPLLSVDNKTKIQ